MSRDFTGSCHELVKHPRIGAVEGRFLTVSQSSW